MQAQASPAFPSQHARCRGQRSEIERQYKHWFLRRLPSGTSIDLPMSPQLQTLIEAMAFKAD